jgi:hypothetical protein
MRMVGLVAAAICICLNFRYLAGAFALAYVMHGFAIGMNAALPSRRKSIVLAWVIVGSIGLGTAVAIEAVRILVSALR